MGCEGDEREMGGRWEGEERGMRERERGGREMGQNG